MQRHHVLWLAVALVLAILVLLEASPLARRPALRRALAWGLGALAAGNLVFVVILWLNHAHFPFTLDVMEFVVLQHAQRVLEHLPIYTAPEPAFAPLAYNPLYYYLVLPAIRVLGPSLFPLRLVAILGMLGCIVVLYGVVRAKTGSAWWGLMAAGLFAAAYRTMDAYLDTAHADSWLLFTALLGTWLIDGSRPRLRNLAGLVLLIASFWFKQHGAVFAIGGILFLTWRDGWARSWGYWLAFLLLGPALYVVAGPSLFGPEFHHCTWTEPRGWSELSLGTFTRLAAFLARKYPVLLLAGAWTFVVRARADGRRLSAWYFQFVFAALSGFMGALDPGSCNNVFIPLGTWIILVGTLGLHELGAPGAATRRIRLEPVALLLCFTALVYDPRTVLVSRHAAEQYRDLVRMLRTLPGTVYAPHVGQFPTDYRFVPAVHWVALDDLERRGPGPLTLYRAVLDPAIHPRGEAWILSNSRLDVFRCLRVLQPYYVLEADLGERFGGLRGLPRLWPHGWPHYLYRFAPEAAGGGTARTSSSSRAALGTAAGAARRAGRGTGA